MAKSNEELAEHALKMLCKAMDNNGYRYDYNRGIFQLQSSFNGTNMEIHICVDIDPKRNVATLTSTMPYTVESADKDVMARAAAMVSDSVISGGIDYYEETGKIDFRMTMGYGTDKVNADFFDYMVGASLSTIDEYNDKLQKVANGTLSLDDLKKLIEG